MSERYFEAHITVEPKVDETFEDFASDAIDNGWKASKFEHDDVDGIAGKWFLSARHHFSEVISEAVLLAVQQLTHSGYNVERWKIEWTLFDSKLGHGLDKLK